MLYFSAANTNVVDIGFLRGSIGIDNASAMTLRLVNDWRRIKPRYEFVPEPAFALAHFFTPFLDS